MILFEDTGPKTTTSYTGSPKKSIRLYSEDTDALTLKSQQNHIKAEIKLSIDKLKVLSNQNYPEHENGSRLIWNGEDVSTDIDSYYCLNSITDVTHALTITLGEVTDDK